MFLEVRNEVARQITRELLGSEWRADDPVATLGGLFGSLANGQVSDIGEYKRLVGRVQGMKDALAMLDETIRQLSDGKL